MKKITVIAIALVLLLTLGVTAFATNGSKNADLFYRDINISLNGTEITPKDANGNVVEPFIIDGTTYLPVRAVAEALGLDVGWDGETSTVILSNEPVPVASSPSDNKGNGKLFITDGRIRDYNGYPQVHVGFQNDWDSDVIRLDILIYGYDAYGEALNDGKPFKGYTNEKIKAHDISTWRANVWELYTREFSSMQNARVGIVKYQLADGTTVEIDDNNIEWVTVILE